MSYYLLTKYSNTYVVKKGYSTIAQLCREFDGKKPIVIKAKGHQIYPGDKFGFSEIKDLLIKVDPRKHKPFEGERDEYSHTLFDILY